MERKEKGEGRKKREIFQNLPIRKPSCTCSTHAGMEERKGKREVIIKGQVAGPSL